MTIFRSATDRKRRGRQLVCICQPNANAQGGYTLDPYCRVHGQGGSLLLKFAKMVKTQQAQSAKGNNTNDR
jgi:hypothetical protein